MTFVKRCNQQTNSLKDQGYPAFDVIIVGGGLAGVSLAFALTQLAPSLKIAIVEAKPNIILAAKDNRTLVLSHGSAGIYADFGLWDTLQPYTYPLYDIHISERFAFGATRFRADGHGVPALGYVIPLAKLQTQLHHQLESQVTWYCPDQVLQLTKQNDDIQLQLQQAGIIHGKLIVAADGAQSTIRQLVNIDVEQKTYSQQALVTTVTTNTTQHTAYKRFSDKGSIALLPTGGGHCGLVWMTDPTTAQHYQTLSDNEFIRILQRKFGYRAGKFINVDKRQIFPLQLIQAHTDIAKQVVLIGHAAHTINPTAAQGFNLSLRDVATLANSIASHLKAGGIISDYSLLEHYSQQRQRDQRNVIKLTDFLTRIFDPDLSSLRIARSIGLFACDVITPLKKHLARQSMGMIDDLL